MKQVEGYRYKLRLVSPSSIWKVIDLISIALCKIGNARFNRPVIDINPIRGGLPNKQGVKTRELLLLSLLSSKEKIF